MVGMNLGDIVAGQNAKAEAEKDRLANLLMEFLAEHVPAPQKETFMVKISLIFEQIGDKNPHRIDIFNKVFKQLHAEN